MQDNICKVPVSATFTIIDGRPVMTAAEYAEIGADVIARFLVSKLGVDAIFSEELAMEGGLKAE